MSRLQTFRAIGTFDQRQEAEAALERLRLAHFNTAAATIAQQAAPDPWPARHALLHQAESRAGQGAIAGLALGSFAGLLLGLLTGLGLLAIPFVGPIMTSEGVSTAAVTTGIGTLIGACFGALVGLLVGPAVPIRTEALPADSHPNYLLLLDAAPERFEEAVAILKGEPVPSSSVEKPQHHLELREEQLQIHKERVPAGEVTIGKEVVEQEQTVVVPLRRDEVVIERRPKHDEPATGEIGTDESIRVPLTAEEPRVQKRPVVSEEVTVHKQQVEDEHTVEETIRRERLHIEGHPPDQGERR